MVKDRKDRKTGLEHLKEDINNSIRISQNMRSDEEIIKNNISISIYLIKYYPLHLFFAVDPKEKGGHIWIDLIKYQYDHEASPHFQLWRDNPVTAIWYKYFLDEWEWMKKPENSKPV